MVDIESEQKQKENLEGYEDFSKYIASDLDLSIYRRFGALGARNILYLQGELCEIEGRLQKLDNEDQEEILRLSGDEKRNILWAAKSWESFHQQAGKAGRQAERMKMVIKLREVMKEYEEAVLRRSQVLSLESPHNGTLDAFQNWFHKKKPFLGHSWNLLNDADDLMALKVEATPDKLTSFVRSHLGYLIRERRHEHPESWGPIYYFPLARVTWIVSIISILIAGCLLLGAIVTLYHVHSPGWRLGVAAMFTALFTASVGLLTNAKKSEIFTATAAYSAVLVVYLSAPTQGATSGKT